MRVTLFSALAFAVVGNVAVARADSADDRIESRVEARLSHDARLKDQGVKVDVDHGVAKLKGKVASEADRARAERLARVAGVTRVDDQLEVDVGRAKDRIEHQADQTKEQIDENARRAKERVDENSERAKARVDEHTRDVNGPGPEVDRNAAPVEHRSDTTGEEINDTWITSKVKTQFVGVDALKGSDISVKTSREGVVTLSGTVPNDTARNRALDIARTTKGVTRVVDELHGSR